MDDPYITSNPQPSRWVSGSGSSTNSIIKISNNAWTSVQTDRGEGSTGGELDGVLRLDTREILSGGAADNTSANVSLGFLRYVYFAASSSSPRNVMPSQESDQAFIYIDHDDGSGVMLMPWNKLVTP